MLCSDRWKWDIKLLQVNKTTGRGNLPEQWMVLMAPCSDSRSVWVGHRAGCVRNLGCRVIFVRQLTTVCAAAGNVCWSCSEGWVRCAEVGFFQVYCLVWLPDDGRECRCTHSVVIAMKNLQIHFIGMRGTLAHSAVRFCKWFCLLISHSLCWTLADK